MSGQTGAGAGGQGSGEGQGQAPDFGAIFSQIGQIQQNLQQAQQAAGDEVVEGKSGGGSVRVAMTGGFEFRSVTIDPAVVDPDDVEMLEDLVLAAVRDAVEQAHGLASRALGGVAGGLGDVLGGGGLDSILGNLFGGLPAGGGAGREGGESGDDDGGTADPKGILGL